MDRVSSAVIETTATVVDPAGTTGVTADMLPAFFGQSRPVEPSGIAAGISEQYGLFYCPRGGKAFLQIETDGALMRQVYLKDPDSGPSGWLITNASVPNVSLVSMEALTRSLPPGASSCQVTIIYSEN